MSITLEICYFNSTCLLIVSFSDKNLTNEAPVKTMTWVNAVLAPSCDLIKVTTTQQLSRRTDGNLAQQKSYN